MSSVNRAKWWFLSGPAGRGWSLITSQEDSQSSLSPAFLQVSVNCPGSKHKMIYQIHAKFTKGFRKTGGRKMDSKCILNLLLGSSFSPEEEWQHEAEHETEINRSISRLFSGIWLMPSENKQLIFLDGIMLIIVVPESDSWRHGWTKTEQDPSGP